MLYQIGSSLILRAAMITAAVLATACYEKTTTEIETAFLNLTVEGDLSSLPADGVSRLTLIAKITAEAAPSRRTVKFKTTSGTLIGSGTNVKEQDVEVDEAGEARIQLQSVKEVGTALVTAEVTLATGSGKLVARQEIAFTGPDLNAIIRFVEAARSAPADGASQSRFTVEVSDGIPLTARSVVFSTTAGSFQLSSMPLQSKPVTLGANRQGTVTLFSPQELGTAEVSAVINDFRTATTIQFVRAPAERILISLDKPSVKNAPDQMIMITATLDRTVGIPTKDTPIFFKVTDVTGASAGHLLQNAYLSNAEGKAIATYSPAGVATPGKANVTVTVEGSTARAEASFEILPATP